MQHKPLLNHSQANGGFTDLYLLGTKRVTGAAPNYTKSSDLTAVALTQIITLQALAVGDCIVFPLAQAWVKQKFTDAVLEDGAPVALSGLLVNIGVTGQATKFIAGVAGDAQQVINSPITAPVAASTAHACLAATNLIATFTSAAGNLSTITWGDLYLYVAISRVGEYVRDRMA